MQQPRCAVRQQRLGWGAVLLSGVILGSTVSGHAFPPYFTTFTTTYGTSGTRLDTCLVCHTTATGGPRNPYGLAFQSQATRDTAALRAIEGLNSDGGVTGVLLSNLEEIQALAFPGNANDEPPLAVAGPAQTVTEGTTVTLDGSTSRDVDSQGSTAVTFLWQQESGPSVVLSDPTAAQPTFTAPAVDLAGASLTFALRVTDNEGSLATERVTVTVSNVNRSPVANAGPDQRVDEGAFVTLDGSQSSDPDGVVQSFRWQQRSGPPVTLSNTTVARPTFLAPAVDATGATLAFDLQVTDDQGLTNTDQTMVQVTNINQPPVADAGTAQTVTDGVLVTLDGTRSFDPDGTLLLFAWRQVSGSPVVLADPAIARPTFTAPIVGRASVVLEFELRVTDPAGLAATARTLVNVTNQGVPPVADAGADQSVAERTQVTLDGRRSTDPDGSPLSIVWRQIDGPAVALSDTTILQPTFTAPEVTPAGAVLTFALRVTDVDNLVSTDQTVVQITDVNRRPVANAGPPQSVQEGATVFLDGSGSADPEETSLTFRWRQVAGALVTLNNANTARPTFSAPAVDPPGVTLLFELVVRDGDGLTSEPAQVMVTVQADDSATRDTDGDGILDIVEESTPQQGDGNGDGVPDSQQPHVASLRLNAALPSLTLVAPAGTRLAQVRLVDNPSPGDTPLGLSFPLGFVSFQLLNVPQGAPVTVRILLPADIAVNAYFHYAATPDLRFAHWDNFRFDGTTGLDGTVPSFTLHFVDGQRGDQDLSANGTLVHVGALTLRVVQEEDSGGEGGGAGGGCTLHPGATSDLGSLACLLILGAFVGWRHVRRTSHRGRCYLRRPQC